MTTAQLHFKVRRATTFDFAQANRLPTEGDAAKDGTPHMYSAALAFGPPSVSALFG